MSKPLLKPATFSALASGQSQPVSIQLFNILQQRARSNEDAMNACVDDQILEDENDDEHGYGNDNEDGNSIQTDTDSVVEEIVSSSFTMSEDWYVLEAADANLDTGYLASQSDERSVTSNTFHYCSISLKEMKGV